MLDRSTSKSSLVMQPAKSSSRLGYVVIATLFLGGPAMVGIITSSPTAAPLDRDLPVVCFLMMFFSSCIAWVLTSIVNMSMSRLELTAAGLTIWTPIHKDVIATAAVRATYNCSNFKYRHLLIQTVDGYHLASSFLWWNGQFDRDVFGGFAEWASRSDIPLPREIDTTSFGLSADQKKVRSALQRCLLRDWYVYIAVVIAIAGIIFTVSTLFRQVQVSDHHSAYLPRPISVMMSPLGGPA